MAPDDLPQRRRGGYKVTAIIFEITAAKRTVTRIIREVRLPAPPARNLTEVELSELVHNLMTPAGEAMRILEATEGPGAQRGYAEERYKRVKIKVMSGERLIGLVNGAQQTFDPRGKMTSAGTLTPIDTTRRNQNRRRPTDERDQSGGRRDARSDRRN